MGVISSAQRRRLPDSAFTIPSRRAYPQPTKAQAAKAGISESQRLRLHKAAISYGARRDTGGSKSKMSRVAATRTGGKVGGRRR
jgi:hypothetical protein